MKNLIYHIDQDDGVLQAIGELLVSRLGEEKVEIKTGKSIDGLDKMLEERKPRLIIADHYIPMNGIEHMQTVRERYPDIGICILSNLVPDMTKSEIDKIGAFYRKPDTKGLFEAIQFYLESPHPSQDLLTYRETKN